MTPLWLAILASAIFWPLYLTVTMVLDVIGLVLILGLSLTKAWEWRYSKVYWPQKAAATKSGQLAAWKGGWLTWLWGNEEDGVIGPWWWTARNAGKPIWWTSYRWSALRNPTNNLRFIPFINPALPHQTDQKYPVQYVGGERWTFTWCWLYAGFIAFIDIGGVTHRFWLGWKLKPEDQDGIPIEDMRHPRVGFATQFKRIE